MWTVEGKVDLHDTRTDPLSLLWESHALRPSAKVRCCLLCSLECHTETFASCAVPRCRTCFRPVIFLALECPSSEERRTKWGNSDREEQTARERPVLFCHFLPTFQ